MLELQAGLVLRLQGVSVSYTDRVSVRVTRRVSCVAETFSSFKDS